MPVPFLLLLLCFSLSLPAQVKPIPPPGVTVAEEDAKSLSAGLTQLGQTIDKLRAAGGRQAELLPDVLIFHRAVDQALRHNEFFKLDDVFRAKELLRIGQERATALLSGRAPWTEQTGLVVRGYVSDLDDTVQPYGLVIPSAYSPRAVPRWRVDTWFHGRAETLSEVNFLYDRLRNPGEFTPADALVLHLYGRYCNANKLAGEVDLFEALDAVRRNYPVDEDRIVVRGFSMGGAAAWHIAAHHAGLWAAAAPGAGFSETPEFLNIWKSEKEKPTWWEQKLWHLYNATDYAVNLSNCPTVAYSGEIDKQMQAARAMEQSLQAEGMRLTHIIGPNTPHRYHPDSKIEINRRLDAIAQQGRTRYPRRVRFTTWTLRYNRMKWVQVDALDRHWEQARVDAYATDDHTLTLQTRNTAALTLEMGSGANLLDPAMPTAIVIDGQTVQAQAPETDGSWRVSLQKTGTQWSMAKPGENGALRKQHGLQGPVDDAFMSRFTMVLPTGTALFPQTAAWTQSEQQRAVAEWRRHFRGDALTRRDTEVSDQDMARGNLVLWGDPGSNQVLARMLSKLPIQWTREGLVVNGIRYAPDTHMPILVFPNPLNPKRYVVLNSGFTWREYDYLNNARQVPKLPDWAVIDVTTKPDARWPGKVVQAGFFGERWEWLKSESGKGSAAESGGN